MTTMDTFTESSTMGFGNLSRTISKTTDVHDARMGMYEYAYRKTADVPREAGGRRRQLSQAKREPKPGTPGERYLLGESEKDAALKSREMEDAAARQDKVDLGLAAMELLDDLRELWQRRSLRSEEWGMVLNFLQIALAGEVFEEFDAKRCRAVRSVIERHLTLAATQDDVDACIDLLESADLDPWKPMAGFRE